MSYAAVPEPETLTVDEYLEREALSERKHEYVAGRIYAFAGASRRHNVVVSRLLQRFLNAAESAGRQVFTSDMLLRAARDVFYYPDVTVVCDPLDDDPRIVTRPCLVVEVLSPSTSGKDLREKLLVYRNIRSLRGYLIVSADEEWIELHHYDDSNGWQHTRCSGSQSLQIPCVYTQIVVSEILSELPRQ